MTTNDGGPAFPRAASEYTQHGTLPDGNDAETAQAGMSLRDWFAGQALVGILALPLNAEEHKVIARQNAGIHTVMAVNAYRYAGAMLAERNKQ